MPAEAFSSIEEGNHSSIATIGDTIFKTSRLAYATMSEAESVVDELRQYIALLEDEPLDTAEFRGARIVSRADGYHVTHAYELVEGPSLARQKPLAMRRANVARTLVQINAMRSFGGDPDSLFVPVDGSADNFHVGAHGPVLVDFFPALLRRDDGSFPVERMDRRAGGYNGLMGRLVGTKSLAMVRLLSGAIDRGDSPIKYALRTVDDWAYDALPPENDMNPVIRARVRAEIRRHFIPYLSRMTVHRAVVEIGR